MIQAFASAVGLYVLYAASFTMCEALFTYVPPLLATGVRFAIVGSILTGYAAHRYGTWATVQFVRQAWWIYPSIAILNLYLGFGMANFAIQHISGVEASLIWNLAPCFTALYAWWIHQKWINGWMLMGIAFSVTSLTPIVAYHVIQSNGQSGPAHVWYLAVCFCAMLADALGWVILKQATTRYGNLPVLFNGISMVIASCALIITFYCLTSPQTLVELRNVPIGKVITLIIALMLIIDVTFLNGYSTLIGETSPLLLKVLGVSVPILTAICSWIWLGSPPPPGFIPTLGWMSVGLSMFYVGKLRHHNTK